jgi:dUTP pyrophosphatase
MTLGQDPQTVGDIPHDHITLSEEPADAGITTGYNMVSVQVKILDDAFIAQYGLPTYETLMAAGFDLRANIPEPVTLRPGQQITVGTGLALYIGDPNYAMYALPRSGLGTKGLVLGNLVGFIDPDYQGELKLTLLTTALPALTSSRVKMSTSASVSPSIRATVWRRAISAR